MNKLTILTLLIFIKINYVISSVSFLVLLPLVRSSLPVLSSTTRMLPSLRKISTRTVNYPIVIFYKYISLIEWAKENSFHKLVNFLEKNIDSISLEEAQLITKIIESNLSKNYPENQFESLITQEIKENGFKI